jgi:hypothetical protein
MLEDAAYYSRREGVERALAEHCADPRVRDVHLLLADRYSELARSALAALSAAEHSDGPSLAADSRFPETPGTRTYR